jgi:hypothetical protein
MKEWKKALVNDESANAVVVTTGSKRKAVREYLLVRDTLLTVLRRTYQLMKRKSAVNTRRALWTRRVL